MPRKFGSSRPNKLTSPRNLGTGKIAGMRPDSNEAIAMRLRCLRYSVAEDNQTRFATQIGIEAKRWNNFERNHPLSKEVALKIVQTFSGVTLDWLFLGREDGLSVQRHRALVAAAEKVTTSADTSTTAKLG